MGALQTVIASLNFEGQGGDDDRQRQRLIFAYGEYSKRQAGFFHVLDKLVNEEGNPIGDFIDKNKLDWPPNENGLLGSSGLFNKLTEEQATDLSSRIESLLPQFVQA